MKRIKTVVKKVTTIILLIVAAFMLIFTIMAMNVNKDYDNGLMGYKFFVVLSDSMKPKFQSGDIVITKVVNPDSLKEGDIITFYVRDGTVVTHQIHEKTIVDGKDAFITKGLNVDQADSDPVVADYVIGEYSFSIPKAGFLIQFLKTTLGYITLILIPFLILVVYNGIHFIKLYKDYKKKQREKVDEKILLEREKNERLYEELQQLKKQLSNGNNG